MQIDPKQLARLVADPYIRKRLALTLDPANWPAGPTCMELTEARERAGLTQVEAAALIWRSPSAWQKWESASDSMARQMDPASFELWTIRVALLRGWPFDWHLMKNVALLPPVTRAGHGGHYDREGRT